MNMNVGKEDCIEHLKLTVTGTKFNATPGAGDNFFYGPNDSAHMYSGRVSGSVITINSWVQDAPPAQAVSWE